MELLEEAARRAALNNATAKARVAPLKHAFRVAQKHATRVDGGKPTEFETACDIVRGSIVCESMRELLVVLQQLLELLRLALLKFLQKMQKLHQQKQQLRYEIYDMYSPCYVPSEKIIFVKK